MFIVWYPREFSRFYNLHPLVLKLSLIRSHLLWGEFNAFFAPNDIHIFPIFHSTRYPLLLGGQRHHGMRSLPDTFTHDQQWESNPRPSDLKCNALLDMSNNKLKNLHGRFVPQQPLSSDSNVRSTSSTNRNESPSVPRSILQHLVNLRYLDMSYNQLTQLQSTSFVGLTNLAKLFLDDNLLFYINGTFQHLPKIECVDLSYNMFEEIDLFSLFSDLRPAIWLNNNPWRCSCNDKHFKEELLDWAHYVWYLPSLTCEETDPRLFPENITEENSLPIIHADFAKCQNTTTQQNIVNQLSHEAQKGLISGAVLFILLFIAVSLFIKFRQFLQIWLYAKCGIRFHCKSQDNVYKKYDAYVAFDDNDTDFVLHELIPRLERELSLKLCIRLRDWLVGDSIADTTLESIHKSHRTILLLSDHFKNSEWSDYEFQVAHHRHLQDKDHNHLIVFLIQDKAPEVVDKTLKMYISTGSYIKLSDPWCWQKLSFVLPKVNEEVAERRRNERTPIEQALQVQGREMERCGYRFHDGSVVTV